MRDFRFSTNVFGVASRQAFIDRCQLVERLGYDTLFVPDHLGLPAPCPVLVAAAEATQRLRVGTLVLNVAFWNPALLAREVATTGILTGGRLELGLGSGHMKSEFDDAGIPWEPFGARADRLEATIAELRRRTEHQPPLIVGGTGDRILAIAAEQADIVAIAGAYQRKGHPPGTLRLGTAAETDDRVAYARGRAGGRADDLEWNVLVQMVIETEDRRGTAEGLSARFDGTMTADEALECPFLLFGTVDEMARQVERQRERYGFTYITVHDPYLEAFAPVIARLRPH